MRGHAHSLALVLVVFLGLGIPSCGRHQDPLSPPPTAPEAWIYPDTLAPLPPDVRHQRLARFRARNPTVDASMDAYGRPAPASHPRPPAEECVPDSAEAVAVARGFLDRNREFFYIAGDLPPVETAFHPPDGPWRIDFGLQTVAGIPVHGTGIQISLVRFVYAAGGGHYPAVRIPASAGLSPEEAQARVPADVLFHCWSPVQIVVRPGPGLMVYPWPTDVQQLDGPLTYRYIYRFWYDDADGQSWQAIAVDAMTGEKLGTIWSVLC